MAVKRNPGNYFLRQSGGCDNALGLVVFRFQNPHDIYLHDTPEQQFFNRDVRALSHGCIRVQQAEKLATLLLALDGAKQKAASLHRAMATYQAKTFTLKKPVPIKITYLTCEIGELGVVEYDDIYQKDKALEMAFYGPNIPDGVKEVKLKTITY
ncbi:murein L,D-transpeptidase [compost metagenome]